MLRGFLKIFLLNYFVVSAAAGAAEVEFAGIFVGACGAVDALSICSCTADCSVAPSSALGFTILMTKQTTNNAIASVQVAFSRKSVVFLMHIHHAVSGTNILRPERLLIVDLFLKDGPKLEFF